MMAASPGGPAPRRPETWQASLHPAVAAELSDRGGAYSSSVEAINAGAQRRPQAGAGLSHQPSLNTPRGARTRRLANAGLRLDGGGLRPDPQVSRCRIPARSGLFLNLGSGMIRDAPSTYAATSLRRLTGPCGWWSTEGARVVSLAGQRCKGARIGSDPPATVVDTTRLCTLRIMPHLPLTWRIYCGLNCLRWLPEQKGVVRTLAWRACSMRLPAAWR